MSNNRRSMAARRWHVPKTAAGRARQLENIARQRERLQSEVAEARKREAKIAAAVRADAARTRAGLERSVGRMLLALIDEKRALAADGDEQAREFADFLMAKLDKAVTDPAGRSLAGLPVEGPEETRDGRDATVPEPAPDIEAILAYLNRERVRCTYGAAGGLLGVAPVAVSRLLGHRRPEASWVVLARTGLPTGYSPDQMHPELRGNPAIIADAAELRERLGLRPPSGRQG